MARQKQSATPARLPTLLISRAEAQKRLADRIDLGRRLLEAPIASVETYETAQQRVRKWTDFNTELLQRIFDNDSFAKEYNWHPGFGSVPLNPGLEELIEDQREGVATRLTRLESLLERLDLVPEPTGARSAPPALKSDLLKGREVFIVHGHDAAAKEAVARFLERLDLEPVVLHEQANLGRTVIEKFEQHSSVQFAVVLLTPDDVGRSVAAASEPRPRARQNVILELGFFLGALGRKRVCALHVGEIEIPSDYDGVLYIPLDTQGGWRLKLAAELRSAGLEVDLNRAV